MALTVHERRTCYRTAATATVFSWDGSETLSDLRRWPTFRTLLGAREKSPPERPAAGLALRGNFLCSRLTSRTRFARSGIAHACRNQSNIITLRQIGSIKTTSGTRATPPSITPVTILAKTIISSRRVLAASCAAILRRCRSGGTGSRVFHASIEAVREIMFRHFRFSFDDCSCPTPTSTPSDSGSRLSPRKLFSATSESSGHKVSKSSRFLIDHSTATRLIKT